MKDQGVGTVVNNLLYFSLGYHMAWSGGSGDENAKQTTRQIEFSDAFKTNIGSCPVRAAITLK